MRTLREVNFLFIMLEVTIGDTVFVTMEDVEYGFLLFGSELVISSVVTPEVRFASEVVNNLEAYISIVFVPHIGKEWPEAPCQSDDTELSVHRALVTLTCGGINAGTVCAPCADGLTSEPPCTLLSE